MNRTTATTKTLRRRHKTGTARTPIQPTGTSPAFRPGAPQPHRPTISDALRLERLERSLYHSDIESAADWRRHIQHDHHEAWIIEDGRGLIASLLLIQARGNLRIEGVAVAKRAQGKGWARRILQHAEDRARAYGKRKLTLEVRPDNARAQAVYRGFGFRVIGSRPAFYEDGAKAIRMAKTLESPSRAKR